GHGRIGRDVTDPVRPMAASREQVQRGSVLAHAEPDLDLVWPAGLASGRDQVAEVGVRELEVERQRMTQNTKAKTGAMTTTKDTSRIRSPFLTLPGCIALNPMPPVPISLDLTQAGSGSR